VTPPPDALLALDGVVAGYGGGDVLRCVTLTVPRHAITCVIGPNGAGKSTLMKVICGLLPHRAGTVTLNGQALTGRSPQQILRSGVVHVPQTRSLFRDMTVRENIALGGYILRDRRLAASRLEAVLSVFPELRQWAGKRAGELSGGQQRLAELARALMLNPALLLLDEPSAGLSPVALRSVFDAIRELHANGTTILLVEQNARAGLRLAHHGIVLENGAVRLAGPGREILRNPEIARLYLGGAGKPGGA
jgi:ABC-type branched-subunit amino acid transport system ATPase component